jgi:hypothetical protein
VEEAAKVTSELEALIETIPGDDGRWKQESLETYLDVAQGMLTAGIDQTQVVIWLVNLYHAAADCYGV